MYIIVGEGVSENWIDYIANNWKNCDSFTIRSIVLDRFAGMINISNDPSPGYNIEQDCRKCNDSYWFYRGFKCWWCWM